MKYKWGERGSVNVLLVPVILLAVLFIGAGAFGLWAFGSRQDYKNNTDQKIAVALQANKKVVQAEDAKTYAEEAKNPLKTFVGPDAYGSLRVAYPKTWSSYVDMSDQNTPVDAYFHTDYVPAVNTDDSSQTYNLRVQVQAQSYSEVLTQYQQSLQPGQSTATPYSLPKVPNVTGVELTGKVFTDSPNKSGTLILLPMRDKTLLIWTESPTYLPDLNTYILPNLTFSP